MAFEVEVPIEVAAPPERVYAIIEDVERWPDWTASVSRVKKLDAAPLAVGSRVEIRQPKLPKAVWRVTALEVGRGFEWEASGPGVHSVAGHWVNPSGAGSRVRLFVRSTGPATWVLGWWMRRITDRYVRMEAEGLKRRAESAG
jgi:uncharacterized membrane protein